MTLEQDPHALDPDYDSHGGFPRFQIIDEPAGFGRFVTAMRRAQDLAVSTDVTDWNLAADRVEELIAYLAPNEVAGGMAPAGRVASLPGAGSILMPPWDVRRFDSEMVEIGVQFSRYLISFNLFYYGMQGSMERTGFNFGLSMLFVGLT